MKRRILPVLFVLAASLVAAAPAFASDNGEGLLGATSDSDVTFFCLGLVVFFILFVTLATIAQTALEKRKEARKAADFRRSVGW